MSKPQELFVFGAGASYGARTPRPPLGNNLHQYVRDYLAVKVNAQELSYIEDGDGTRSHEIRNKLDHLLSQTSSFETLANSLLSQQKLSLLQKLNSVMACALTPPINDDPKVDDAFTEKTDFYDEFLARKLRNKDELQNARFISLNYDCLLERAICRRYEQPLDGGTQCLCSHVNYRLTEKAVGIEVLKPHGSINWVADQTLGDGRIEQDSSIPLWELFFRIW